MSAGGRSRLRLLRNSKQSTGTCLICLDPIANKSVISNCMHEYCYTCILKWSRVKNACPACRQEITSFYHDIKSPRDYKEHVVPLRARLAQKAAELTSIRSRSVVNIVRLFDQIITFFANTDADVSSLYTVFNMYFECIQALGIGFDIDLPRIHRTGISNILSSSTTIRATHFVPNANSALQARNAAIAATALAIQARGETGPNGIEGTDAVAAATAAADAAATDDAAAEAERAVEAEELADQGQGTSGRNKRKKRGSDGNQSKMAKLAAEREPYGTRSRPQEEEDDDDDDDDSDDSDDDDTSSSSSFSSLSSSSL